MPTVIGTSKRKLADCCDRIGRAIIGHTARDAHIAAVAIIIGVTIGDGHSFSTGIGDLVVDTVFLEVVIRLLDVVKLLQGAVAL